MSWLRLITVQVVLLSALSCFAAEPNAQNEQEKTIISKETAQDWIQAGTLQLQKGLYEQAEKSFLAAKEYQEYLTVEEQKQLEKHIAEANQGIKERQPVLAHIKKAKELLSEGQTVKARAHYEAVRKSPYLTEQERKQIEEEIKKVDSSFDKQRNEITEIYNRSVQLYRAGEIEKARDGFVEVAKYGMLVVPKGQTAEDYLIQIDSILTEKLKNQQEASASQPPAALPSAKEVATPKNAGQPVPSETKEMPLEPVSDKTENKPSQANQAQQEAAEVAAAAEPQAGESSPANEQKAATENGAKAVADKEAKVKIVQTYTKAVVDDAAKKVEYYIGTGEFDRAIAKVRTATEVVKTNRPIIGDELFTQYSIRLKQLADNIIQAKKAL